MTWRFIYFISVDGIIEDMRLHQEISSEDTKSALQVSRSLAADKYADHLMVNGTFYLKLPACDSCISS